MVKKISNVMTHKKPTPSTVDGRWSSLGPYYAMFPIDFSLNTIEKYTKEGDWILDPFCGRGTVPYTAEMLNRHAVGIEISKLGWLYSSSKLNPASKQSVLKRAEEILDLSLTKYKYEYKNYNEFFQTCYAPNVLNYLVTAREELNWKKSKIDRTLMSFIAVSSHGELGQAFSNQMQHVKACGPNYAIKWWKEKGFEAPKIDPLELLKKKIEWRYLKGKQTFDKSKIYLGNSEEKISTKILKNTKFKMLFTSPPYFKVTNYHLDQWIRLWLLGEVADQKFNDDPNRNNFGGKEHYEKLLHTIFSKSKNFLTDDAIIYVRTDAREYCKNFTIQMLTELYSNTKTIKILERPFLKRTQTALHGDLSQKPGEVDIILTPK